jgi:hypothetical protein
LLRLVEHRVARNLPHCRHAAAAVRALLGCQQRINRPYSLFEARAGHNIGGEWTLTIR